MSDRNEHAEPTTSASGRLYVTLRDDRGRVTHYDLTRIGSTDTHLASWRWLKIEPETGEKLAMYTTHRTYVEGSECCTCDGFSGAGRCKHVRFLRALGVFGPHHAEIVAREKAAAAKLAELQAQIDALAAHKPARRSRKKAA